ncbi:isoprenoid synthase domain-containing protein [Suillus discolor]|uniref:Terpene synthase n=1 Tax=Suillus discolor TaxID=1912936 RepID=A0A9P7JQS0_9AGAM|nr:isoprenoid synthase domain-containing protein [Suillus discolor]KAG2099847.1 isoprenoid synthase domain-containing protein [Suillus discolor]
MDARPKTIYLPDTMVTWPWPRTINPHYKDVKAEVDASFRDFKALSPKSQEAFDKCDFARLTALAYPNLPREHLRSGCDLMNLSFIVEEYTDMENEAVTKERADILLDALHNPHKIRPEGECIIGEIARQSWARVIQFASLPSQRHFLDTFDEYINSVVVEARDREQGHMRSLDDYLKLRRKTIGVKPCFPILEAGIDLPDEVFYHPVIMDLAECITDLVLIDNDMISYNKEQAVGHEGHNIISIIMFDLGLDVSGAMAWAAHYHTEVQKRFIDGLAKVPSWGPSVDVLVKEYLDGTAMFVRGNHSWSYQTRRYLATMGPEIQKTRLVPLLPRPDHKVM